MRFAVPVANGKLTMHFGHCEAFAIIDVDAKTNKIVKEEEIPAPPHEPGLLPKWLGERDVTTIIAGGMGQRAQQLFAQQNIKVLVGAPSLSPAELIKLYLSGDLTTGTNACDH
jgi:predicted Fe-Mo cluster-binding NifX family protein